jgi:hypothetical protein
MFSLFPFLVSFDLMTRLAYNGETILFAEHTFDESRQIPKVGEGSGWLNVMDLGVFSEEPFPADGTPIFPFLIFVCSFIRSSSLIASLIVGWEAREGAAQGRANEREVFRFAPCIPAAGFSWLWHCERRS